MLADSGRSAATTVGAPRIAPSKPSVASRSSVVSHEPVVAPYLHMAATPCGWAASLGSNEDPLSLVSSTSGTSQGVPPDAWGIDAGACEAPGACEEGGCTRCPPHETSTAK